VNKVPRAVILKGVALCILLFVAGHFWREVLKTGDVPGIFSAEGGSVRLPTLHHPLFESLKLVAAFFVGLTVTVVHRTVGHAPSFSPSMERAQILLCVSGALMMIIIGDSLARAFGIAGAASIIRFRTPVDDPQDTIVLFLSLGLGMACGLGAFGIVGLGTAFICGVLMYLAGPQLPRKMTLTIVAATQEFPATHVLEVLQRHRITAEIQEMTQGTTPGIAYRVQLDPQLPLEHVSDELRANPAILSVGWELPRKKKRPE
jgi:hypothetical protein